MAQLVYLVMVLVFSHSVAALKCYEAACAGDPPVCSPKNPELRECNSAANEVLCLEVTILGVSTVKSCGSACPPKPPFVDGFTCDTCKTDGCNSSGKMAPAVLMLLAVSLGAIFSH